MLEGQDLEVKEMKVQKLKIRELEVKEQEINNLVLQELKVQKSEDYKLITPCGVEKARETLPSLVEREREASNCNNPADNELVHSILQ